MFDSNLFDKQSCRVDRDLEVTLRGFALLLRSIFSQGGTWSESTCEVKNENPSHTEERTYQTSLEVHVYLENSREKCLAEPLQIYSQRLGHEAVVERNTYAPSLKTMARPASTILKPKNQRHIQQP